MDKEIIISQQEEKIKELNRKIDQLYKLRKAESRKYHELKCKQKMIDAIREANLQKRITSGHLEQLAQLAGKYKTLKMENILLKKQLEYEQKINGINSTNPVLYQVEADS